HPEPGCRLLQTRGDSIAFTLTLPKQQPGQAWLRTNLGQSRTIRREIMRSVTHDESLLGRDWFDIRMEPAGGDRFRIVLGLCEIGHFEAKCFFIPEGASVPIWPAGDNVTINIAPTDTCCANIVYNAFVRQFGPNKDGSFAPAQKKKAVIEDLDRDGYTVIPPSGTFRDLIAELDFIIGYLGCRFIQLLPVNPTPTTYGRMGRFGSPYASLDFTSIDPALAEFDPGATPLEQFIELVDAVHARAAKLILDIAPNHTGWAAELHETHPEWLVRDATGNIEAPGAWGVTWADLARLDYRHKDLWQYMGEVFLVWCRRGVDGFRCDAGYMIPIAAWLYIISAVRSEFPETIFFLEGLGGKLSVTRRLLNKGGFDWAYSELFQNYDRAQIEGYLPEPLEASARDGIMVNFAETHDNNRLAATSTRYAAMRTALCALCAPRGGFGFANGVEWFAGEKIDVHEAKSLNWGSRNNQTKQIRRISCLLKTHPAFFDQADIRMIQNGGGEALVFVRRHEKSGKRLLIAANLDWQNPQQARWYPGDAGIKALRYTDLLSDEGIEAGQAEDGAFCIDLAPGRVLCLSPEEPGSPFDKNPLLPERIGRQRLRAAALEVFQVFFGTRHLGDFDPESAAAALAKDPEHFCRQLNPDSEEPRTIPWHWPADCRRQVMVPPGHILLIKAPAPFRARLVEKSGKQGRSREKTCHVADSMEQAGGENFALLFPPAGANAPMQRFLRLSVYETTTCTHAEAPLLYLGGPEHAAVRRLFGRRVLKSNTLKFLGTNGRGAMM
ncbi:MAG TPA: glycogen debranching protein, partial [Desulfosalsimonadaceae bacterium]|nr:glycogen debranching protein [Desulfosalsimonadaceae bacterium]